MISKFAIDEIEKMQEEGLSPSPRDIIRLNAIALKIEEARGKDVTHSDYLLPRVAWLREGVFFRQPAVGHEIWITAALKWVKSDDYQTVLALNCYALSRSVDELTDASDPDNIAKAVNEYAEKMRDFTTDQLYAAVAYVKFGANHADGESVPRRDDDEDTDKNVEDLKLDWDECVAVGSLREGAAVLWGLSIADMKRMTRRELDCAIYRSYYFHGKDAGFESREKNAIGDFYRVKNEIIERLRNEHGTTPSV